MTSRNENQPPKAKPLGLHAMIQKGLKMGIPKEKMAEVMGVTVDQVNAFLMLQSEN